MSLTTKLAQALENGVNQIGQIRILQNPLRLHHIDDTELDSLEVHTAPDDAREIGLYSPDGEYRFTKGELSLKQGWIFHLENLEDLRRTIDLFYPASLGLWQAQENGTIRVQNLRDKLGRQTGMYRHAGTVSDEGAQELVKTLCGPSNKCVKKILWQLDCDKSLDDSEASRFEGIVGDASKENAIPMVCQEACNFFVAQARKKSKAEFEAKALWNQKVTVTERLRFHFFFRHFFVFHKEAHLLEFEREIDTVNSDTFRHLENGRRKAKDALHSCLN